jgi:broad specificity phosphatase PhoE
MTTLYFMRHAESEANLADILASQLDFPLTNKGENDALEIAKEVKQFHPIDHIISSPLLRAKQTAAPFEEEFDLTAFTDPDLIEQHLGKFSGKTYAELDSEPDYCHDRSLRWKWIPDGGGESYEMIANRLQPFFDKMFKEKHEHILIITHAVTLRMVKSILTNMLPDYPKDIAHNGEIWQVDLTTKGNIHEIKSHFYGASKAAISRA